MNSGNGLRKVLVLINPRSGGVHSVETLLDDLESVWDRSGIDLCYQFSRDKDDGRAKAERAVAHGTDTILVVGGDGMVNSIGAVLIGSDTALGVVPAGSGNGFARHFGIPLQTGEAIRALRHAPRRRIDVGTVNGRPFFVTCSLAWDGALVRTFERFPVRGIFPYVFAAVTEYIGYEPQPFDVLIDDATTLRFEEPVVFTIANLTQYGGGARIAPQACPDDGRLELVVILRRDIPRLLPKINRLFDGTLDEMREVVSRAITRMRVNRDRPDPIQIDGELVQMDGTLDFKVLPQALLTLTPTSPGL